jgi:hypothetical protein
LPIERGEVVSGKFISRYPEATTNRVRTIRPYALGNCALLRSGIGNYKSFSGGREAPMGTQDHILTMIGVLSQ